MSSRQRSDAFRKELSALLTSAAIRRSADPAQINYPMVFLLLFALSLLGVMTYGPIAAWLVELFPARIRYTSMSLPYHLGNGWFGGFLPSIAFAMIAYTGNIYSGLWYPVLVCLMTVRRRHVLPARDQGRRSHRLSALRRYLPGSNCAVDRAHRPPHQDALRTLPCRALRR